MVGLKPLAADQRPPLQAGEALIWLHRLPAARDHAAAHAVLRHTLAHYLGTAPQRVPLHCPPGHAPHTPARWQGLPLSLSLSYAQDWLLLGLCAGARVGVDLLTQQAIPDWREVATLYLGPQVCTALAATPLAQTAQAFAQAWTALEARGKAFGRGLQEYDAEREAAQDAAGVSLWPLHGLPPHLTGAAALIPAPA